MMSTLPTVTVISTNLNHGRFLRATIESVLKQSYERVQYIVIDGGSTDDSLDILRNYSEVEWISEKDSGSYEAFEKGMKMAKGEFLMQCAVTDGYLDQDWIKKCVEAFVRDSEISLVWGLSRHMSEDGKLLGTTYPQFASVDPPQKQDYLYYWLATFLWFPEGNFCIRRSVFEQCFPRYGSKLFMRDGKMVFDPWLEFNYHFNRRGYLPAFVRTDANFGRFHSDQRSQQEVRDGAANTVFDAYVNLCKEYRSDILAHPERHRYHDAKGRALAYTFKKRRFVREQMLTLRYAVNVLKPIMRPLVKWAMQYEWFARLVRKLKRFA